MKNRYASFRTNFRSISSTIRVITLLIALVAGLSRISYSQITVPFSYTGSIVNWTVPTGVGTITITARGAQGGSNGGTGGLGAIITGTFTVSAGQVLSLLVGQQPPNNYSFAGGGGGTFVALGSSYASASPLVVAGGGGGSSSGNGGDASTGNNGNGPAPGTSGNGAPSTSCGGGGGGFYSSGGNDVLTSPSFISYGGAGFRQGGAGGSGGTYYSTGGFGGGAACNYYGSCNMRGGAGGGYSGGSGLNSGGSQYVGYGGGSYNGGSNQSNTVGNTGNGSVSITYTVACQSCPTYDFGIFTPTIIPATHASSTTEAAGCKIYAFNVIAGFEYYWSVCSNGGTYSGDSRMILYDNACTALVNVDDACGTGPQINWTATYTGTVYIRMAHYSNGGTASWTMAYWKTIPPGENCTNAQNLASLSNPFSGSTLGYADDVSTCRSGYPDRVFYIDVPNYYRLEIWEPSNDYNEYEYVGYGSSCPGTQIQCWDNDALAHTVWINTTGSTQRVWYIQDACCGVGYGNFTLQYTLAIACPTLGSVSNSGPINFCNAGGDFGGVSVSGQVGTVVWDWGSNNGVWNNNWVTSNSSGTCCFPKKTSNSDGNADRIRYRVSTGGCTDVTSSTIMLPNGYNEAPTSLASSTNSYCSFANPGTITLTATFPSSINKNGTVNFYSGSCGGTLVGSVTAADNTATAAVTITAPASTTVYYVRYEPGSGTGCSNTACATTTVTVPVISNDACANAIDIGSSLPYTSPVISTTCATDDVVWSSCDGPYKNIWWKVTCPPCITTLTAITCTGGTNFDDEIAIFTGSCGNMTPVTCNDDNGAGCSSNYAGASWSSIPGTVYYITAGSYYSGGPTGNLQLNVTGTADASAPVLGTPSVNNSTWICDNKHIYAITVSATDPSGFGGTWGILALINYQGTSAGAYGGYFGWHPSSYVHGTAEANHDMEAVGGGYASQESATYGPNASTLVGCTTSLVGTTRTVTFYVRPSTSFPILSTNAISVYAVDPCGNTANWTNTQLNFISVPSQTISMPPNINVCGSQVVNYSLPTANGGTAVALSSGYASGSVFPTGTTTVTWNTLYPNGAGGTFNYAPGASNQTIALAACESVYGAGNCNTGSCGNFTYYKSSASTSCDCSKPVGQYEFIYANAGYTTVGADYGGHTTDVTSNSLFTRVKTAGSCNANSWTLTEPNLGGGGASGSFNVIVGSIPSSPAATANPSAICPGSASNLIATSAGNTISWYNAPTGGTFLGSSNSGAAYTVSPSVTTQYYAEAITSPTGNILAGPTHTNNSTGGYTLGYSFTPNVNIIVTGLRRYFGTKISIWNDAGTLIFSQAVSGTDGTWTQTTLATPVTLLAGVTYRIGAYTGGSNYYWKYGGSSTFANGTINASYEIGGDAFPTSTDGVSWWFVDLAYSGCASSRTAVTVTVTPAPSAPSPVTATTATICTGGTSQLNGVSAGNSINWWSASSGGSLYGLSLSGANYPVTPSGTTTYYAESTTNSVQVVSSLGTSGSNSIECVAYTGDDRGGIVITQNYVFLTGDVSTARFNHDLSGPVALTACCARDHIFSDLAGAGKVYSLANSAGIPTSGPIVVDRIQELDASMNPTGSAIMLSSTITETNPTGIYSGNGFVIVHTSSAIYRIALPSGTVTTMTYFSQPSHTGTESVTYYPWWGWAEYNGTDYSVVYVQNSTTISRMNLTTGAITTAGSFSNLSDMASIIYSPWDSRWYFHHEGTSQFRSGDETVGYADASINTTTAGGCASSSRTSVSVTITTDPVVTITGTTTICEGGTATYTVSNVTGGTGTPTYQWYFKSPGGSFSPLTNGSGAAPCFSNVSGAQTSSLSLPLYSFASACSGYQVYCLVTYSGSGCDAANSNTITTTVNPTTIPAVSIGSAPSGAICAGTSVTFTASPTNGGSSPTYQWKLNGTNTVTGTSYASSSLANNDVVSCVMLSNAGCTSPVTATSSVTMTVNPILLPTVSIAASPVGAICPGTNVTFTPTPGNGGTPAYTWYKNGTSVGTSSTWASSALVNSDVIKCVLVSNATCASPVTATSNLITMTVNPNVTPSMSIGANPSGAICAGTSVTFTASPTNGGGAPAYQWKLNGVNTNTGTTYSSSALANNDVVSCVLVSNATCALPVTATSSVTMTVNPLLTPVVSIGSSPSGAICAGTSVSFTASPTNGGSTPSYQWKLNGTNTVTGSTYSSSGLANNDVVSCIMVSNATCPSPSTATSSLTMTVNPVLLPTVSIAALPSGAICPGTNVTFTPTPTNGGTPAYTWYKNGTSVGTSSTWASSALVNSDVIKCVLVSNATCASPVTATSNQITMTVNPNVTPSVSIGANPSGAVCAGTSVTFTASPTNGGGAPAYQWKLNGVNTNTGTTYSSSSLANNDVVSCILVSNATCALPVTATSSVTMTVNPVLLPAVSILASPSGSICPGTNVTFTPTPVNGGTPVYQWYKNGGSVGTGNSWSSSGLVNNDAISCVMISNATCASPVTATSNTINTTVIPNVTPSVVISPDVNPVCPGTTVNFTASPANGGSTPVYQWQVNGSNTGNNAATFSFIPVNGDVVQCIMGSNANCASPVSATSASITMVVKTLSVSPSGATATQNVICAGSSTQLDLTGGSLGTGADWQWYSGSCGGASVGSGASLSLIPAGTTTYYVRAEGDCNNSLCASVVVTVKTLSVAPTSVTALPSSICAGASTTVSINGGTLGTGASWQWYTGSCGGITAGNGLSLVITPAVTTTYYARAEGDCNNTLCGSVVVSVSACMVNWTGNADSNWNNAANWSNGMIPGPYVDVTIPSGRPHQPEIFVAAQCQSLNIANGAVLTIRPHYSLTARGATTLNGAQCLVIKSTAAGSGSFIDNGTITGTGTAKVERYLTGTFWHYIGSPIQSATAAVYSGQYLKKWLEPTYTWQNITTLSTPLVAGTGYAVKSLNSNTYNYIGKLNTGPYSFAVTRNTTQVSTKRGWNLMGNPYPSAINWDAPVGWTKTNVYNSIYIYNQTYGTYATYVNGFGTNGAGPYIASGQGFFIVCSASPGGTLAFNNTVRLHKDTTFFKTLVQADLIRLNLEDNGQKDDIIIRITPDATNNFDSDFDAFKMVVPGVSQLWSNPIDGEVVDYAINSLPDIAGNPDIPVAFMPAHNGNYIIRASDYQSLGAQTSIYLEDLKTGVLSDLLDNPVYSFTGVVGDDVNRFVLHFGFPVITSVENAGAGPRVSVYPNPVKQNLSVNISDISENVVLQITDNLGRVLYSKSVNPVKGRLHLDIDVSEYPSGVYLLNIRDSEMSRVAKFVKN
ncbi:MAG: T9SS type A sorting domain-containing protein [Bacteroidota bacterium]